MSMAHLTFVVISVINVAPFGLDSAFINASLCNTKSVSLCVNSIF